MKNPGQEGAASGGAIEPRVSLITLGVADLAASLRFYRDGLGWRPSSASQGDVAFFQLGCLALALYPRDLLAADAGLAAPGGGFAGITLAHNVREREQVDALLDFARQVGGRILKAAEDASWGGRSGYFADPDGYAWEVAWNPYFPLAPDGALVLPE